MSYDVMYQDWLIARKAKDYMQADTIRDEFERLHGLTIFAEGTMPIEGVTVRRMTLSKWASKYGSVKQLHAVQASDGVHGVPLMAMDYAI